MKRVGNKSGQLVRSASRRGKATSRFQFDITVDRVHGVRPGATYYVKWSRGVKVAQTRHFLATPESAGKAGLPVNHKLSLLVTLYRDDSRKFDPKDAKLSLVSVSPKKQERTTAKIHFDLSQFAGVPSASTTKVFKLSDKVSIRATVESRFLKAGAAGPGSAGASSALSGVSARSSDDDLDDDFDDLAINDVPEPNGLTSTSVKSKKAPPMTKPPSNGPSSRVPLVVETPRSMSSTGPEQRKKAPSPAPQGNSSPKRGQSPTTRPRRERPAPVSSEDVMAFSRAEDDAKISKLTKENQRLSADLERFKTERASTEQAHKTQLAQLNSRLEDKSREVSAAESQRASNSATVVELTKKSEDADEKVRALTTELEAVKKSRDGLKQQARKLDASEQKCRELSREVDRLTVAAAGATASRGDERGNTEVEERIAELRKEKEVLESKVKAHEVHAAKVKSTYQKLSQMYNELRAENNALQKNLDQRNAEKKREGDAEQKTQADRSVRPVQSTSNDATELQEQLEDARLETRDIKTSKDALQSDYDRLLYQVDSLQERLENTSQMLDDARRENDELFAETEELKGQRDMAMQRALSKGKSNPSAQSDSARSVGRVEEELRLSKEKYEREHTRLTRRMAELEGEISDLKEDVEYEKSEKMKAREERDKIRESARAMERRTSMAARQNDAMHSMRRQLSTHQMREQDHEAMIVDLRNQVEDLTEELEEAKREARKSSGSDEVGEVLQVLVATKLALAQAEDEKLNLQFAMKTLKKSEKSIQERLAAHASRLEVKLGQANEELERLKRRRDALSEFNELGEDVDY